MADKRHYLDGEPYYCVKCGAGGPEYYGCEMPDCELETKEAAVARRERSLEQENEK